MRAKKDRPKAGTSYIMDTCCRNMTAEDKTAADRKIIQILVNDELRKGNLGSA